MYENTYLPIDSLRKAPVINVGGLCKLLYFKVEDVQQWPVINPLTGVIQTQVLLKPGRSFYFIDATEEDRTFKEDDKADSAGPYVDILVTATLAGNTTTNTLSAAAMRLHQWGVIAIDRNGDQRLIGNEDSGASFSSGFTTATSTSSRKRKLQFAWQHSTIAPVYVGDNVAISAGNITISVGSLTPVIRFRVGDAGAPMNDGDTVYTNPMLAGKRVLVIASGLYVPVDYGDGAIDFTGSIERHIAKTLASSTLTWIGGVVQNEVIEIYAIS